MTWTEDDWTVCDSELIDEGRIGRPGAKDVRIYSPLNDMDTVSDFGRELGNVSSEIDGIAGDGRGSV
jgi:hypothetical protein